jgi:hypothetical protein
MNANPRLAENFPPNPYNQETTPTPLLFLSVSSSANLRRFSHLILAPTRAMTITYAIKMHTPPPPPAEGSIHLELKAQQNDAAFSNDNPISETRL